MKRTIHLLCLSCLFLCVFISGAYAFSVSSGEKDAAPGPSAISQESEAGTTVDMELSEDEQADENLQVKANRDKAAKPLPVEGIKTESDDNELNATNPKLR